MCGLPGAGKSTYVSEIVKNSKNPIIVLDGDTLKTSSKIANEVKKALNENKSVIVDACNHTLARRADIIKVAVSKGVPVTCVCVITPLEECVTRVKKREADGGKSVPPVAVYTVQKHYIPPTLEEGFEEILIKN